MRYLNYNNKKSISVKSTIITDLANRNKVLRTLFYNILNTSTKRQFSTDTNTKTDTNTTINDTVFKKSFRKDYWSADNEFGNIHTLKPHHPMYNIVNDIKEIEFNSLRKNISQGVYRKTALPGIYSRLINIRYTNEEECMKLVEEIKEKNVSMNDILLGYVLSIHFYHERNEEGIKFGESYFESVRGDGYAHRAMLGMYCKLEKNDKVIEYIKRMRQYNVEPLRFYPYILKWVSLSDITLARKLFDELKKLPTIRSNAVELMMIGYSKVDQIEEAIKIFYATPKHLRTTAMYDKIISLINTHPDFHVNTKQMLEEKEILFGLQPRTTQPPELQEDLEIRLETALEQGVNREQ